MPIHEVFEMARLVISPVAIGLILIGLYFLFAAVVGVLRLPDLHERCQPTTYNIIQPGEVLLFGARDDLGSFVLLWVDRATGIAYLQDVDIA